jgi:hypothetical protein
MHFTRSPLKNKKPLNNGTNKMGQYYSNIHVPIKNYNKTPIATRIDKNMTNLSVPENLTNKNLNQFIQPALEPVVLEPETDLNIFNYKSNTEINMDINVELTEETEEIEEIELTINKDLNIFDYKYDNSNVKSWIA